jgi:FkbM family methyltransferase
MPNHRELRPDSNVGWTKQLLMQPPGPWPSQKWVGYPSVIQAFKELLSEAAASPPPPPAWSHPRGIVICGGGWRFFPGVYVTCRVIRHIGCKLPIQVFYLGDAGEFDGRMAEITAPLDVGWICANSMWRERPEMQIRLPNIDHGWMLKPFAAAYSCFQEVICLDADCYPVYNPETFMEHPEYRRVGAAFWPDHTPLKAGQWERFGIPPQQCPALESGQFIVDKARHWRALWLVCFLNACHDYVYAHVYGDKDTFNLGWRKVADEMCVPTAQPGWHVHSFLQKDFDGRTLFVHRTQDKFKLTGEIDGQGIPSGYNTKQTGPTNRHAPGLPLEDFCFKALREVDQLLRPDLYFDLWGQPAHKDIWLRITRQNEYRFAAAYTSDDVAVDVGACVGAAAMALLLRGMAHVFCVEPMEGNLVRLEANLASYRSKVTILPAAAWRSDQSLPTVPLYPRADCPDCSTVLNSYIPQEGGGAVPAVPFDDVIRSAAASAGGRVRLVKIDAEGAEYPCLLTSQALDLVDEIIGEWHRQEQIPDHARVGDIAVYNEAVLTGCLEAAGFNVTLEHFSAGHGLFWARRPAREPAICAVPPIGSNAADGADGEG